MPLVPVAVPQSNPAAKKENIKAILPSNAVKLRETAPRKQANQQKRGTTTGKKQLSKSTLNDKLSKPYVLWPICVGILAAAFFVGLKLRNQKTEIADGDPPVVVPDPGDSKLPIVDPVEKPDDEEPVEAAKVYDVSLRILPDATDATLLIDGQKFSIDRVELEPGEYKISIEKDGFEPFESSLAIDADNRSFDISLVRKLPSFLDVSIALSPVAATLQLNGKAISLQNGKLRLDPSTIDAIELLASAEGYQTKTEKWSIEELESKDFRIQLALEKLPVVAVEKAKSKLPASLVPKPDSLIDETSGLPLRALARALIGSAPLELALVVPGSYTVGGKGDELRTWERRSSVVKVDQPFYIGINEVTNAQFQAFIRETTNDREITTTEPNFPVSNVSVRKAAQFCEWIGGRLPTETEWEAAVRGINDNGFPLPWGNSDLGQERARLFRGEAEDKNKPIAVDSTPDGASATGLLNTIGNVSEWCDNQLGADQFIVKGCSFRIPPGNHVKVSWRNQSLWTGADDIGMRVLVPVAPETNQSAALSFLPPSNIDSVLVSTNLDDDQTKPAVYTKTIEEIASEFSGPAELVIDSGGFMDEITDLDFSPNGKQIAVAGGKVVRIWDVTTGRLETTIRGDMSRTSYGNVNATAWSPDGEFLLTGVSDYRDHGNIRVYATNELAEVAEVLTGHNAPCRKLCFSRDGKYLVSADADGLVIVRNWEDRKILHRIEPRDREQPIFDVLQFAVDQPFLLGVDFQGPQAISAEDGARLGGKDQMPPLVRGWLVDVFNKFVPYPYDAKLPPRVMDFQLESGRWAGAGSARVDGRSKFWVRLWRSREPVASAIKAETLATYDKHRWRVTAISLQPKGSLVASGDKFGEVHVWDAQTGERKFKFSGQGKPIYEVAFDKDSSRLAFGTTPYKPGVWNRNNHGDATRVLDLRERAIADAISRKNLKLLDETPEIGEMSVGIRKEEAWYHIERKRGSQTLGSYRVSAGRNPTVYTMLDQEKMGVEQPVIFGDNEGLLAMWDSAGDELKRAFIGHGGLVSAVSASPNGKLIASSSTDRTIRLWSLENHKPTGTFDFKFENSAVREVIAGSSSAIAGVAEGDKILSIDGKSLTEMFELMLLGTFDYAPGSVVPVTLDREGRKFTYQMTMVEGYDFVEPVLNFYMGDDGQWIIWHPQGYYDASPGADHLIGWHVNRGFDKSAKFFEVQQFKSKLYRPDIINGILETGSLKDALAAVEGSKEKNEEIDFREPETIAEYHPPNVRITSPDDQWRTESAQIKVTGEATSVNGLPLTALTLLHNGSVAKVFRPTQLNQLRMEIEYEMQLSPGQNDLVLIAANAKSSSQGQHIVVDQIQSAPTNRSNAVVLAIGVSKFEHLAAGQGGAAADATVFVESLQSHKNGRLYNEVKANLLSGDVSDHEILEGLQWLADNTSDGDVAMLYISTQAIVDRRDNFYIGASNTKESKARSTAVSWRDITDTLRFDLPDCKRMVFLDLQPTENSIKPGLRNPLLDLAAPEMGAIFISSNTLQQRSLANESSGSGVFMKAVLETVADQNFDTNPNPGDALFNPVELAAGVTNRVKSLTNDQQQPVFFSPESSKSSNVLELQN